MPSLGFIHDKLDMKMLILYLLSHIVSPIDLDTLASLVMNHEGVILFDFTDSLADLVRTGHVEKSDVYYKITEKGRGASRDCESSLAYSVRRHCNEDTAKLNATLRRNARIHTEKSVHDDTTAEILLSLDDDSGNILSVRLACPSVQQAERLISGFTDHPEQIYNELIDALTVRHDKAGDDVKQDS